MKKLDLFLTQLPMRFLQLIFFTSLFTSPLIGANEKNGDFRLYNQNTLSVTIAPSYRLQGNTAFWFKDNASFFFYKYFTIGLEKDLSSWISFKIAYRQIQRREKDAPWTPTYSPYVNFDMHGDVKGWNIAYRPRIQLLFSPHSASLWLLRNRLTVMTPWKWTILKIQPYFFDELYILRHYNVVENRLGAGVEIHYLSWLKNRIYYAYDNTKSLDGWFYYNLLELDLELDF